ncbi:MAG: hypothetical protein IJ262_03250 [Clostridia bacterium]|nr:hypothetical protein [Clostridia bacterium]
MKTLNIQLKPPFLSPKDEAFICECFDSISQSFIYVNSKTTRYCGFLKNNIHKFRFSTNVYYLLKLFDIFCETFTKKKRQRKKSPTKAKASVGDPPLQTIDLKMRKKDQNLQK